MVEGYAEKFTDKAGLEVKRNVSYVSYTFVLFVMLTVFLYYKVPRSWQWRLLLIASLVFYIYSGFIYLIYLLLFALVTWYSAGKIERYLKREKHTGFRRFVLVVMILFNLATLFILKWAGMEIAFMNRLFGMRLAWHFILPLGMSFFTFQNVSYLIDVYNGKIPAEKNFGHYLLYSTYFPYIVSGPINRYEHMEKQFYIGHSFRKDMFYSAVLRILWGYLKKMVIADRAAIFVDQVFDHYYMYRGLFVLFAVLLFSLQLYMDFSGCMDIVIGVSQLFGIEMKENFMAPYGADTVAEFWRRWHMSLTSWFRDYLYIPLGGNRQGKFRKYLNIMLVFLLCGAWHGAGFTFLIWGFLNGFYQIVGDMTAKIRRRLCYAVGLDETSYGAVLRKRLITFLSVEFAWLFFRASGIHEAFAMIRRMFTGWNPWILSDGTLYEVGLDIWDFLILLMGTVCISLVSHFGRRKNLHYIFMKQSWLCQICIIILAIVIWYLFGIYGPGYDSANFIYYNF